MKKMIIGHENKVKQTQANGLRISKIQLYVNFKYSKFA